MMKTSFFFLYFLVCTAFVEVHEFHLSKSVVAYSAPDQALQITLHLFIDDLEAALRAQGKDKLFICTDKEAETAEEAIYEYIQQNFQFEINQERKSYEFIGKEPSEDLQAVWCYLEIPSVTALQEMTIKNSILTEMFADQKNIVNIVGPNKKKSYLIMSKAKSTEHIQY